MRPRLARFLDNPRLRLLAINALLWGFVMITMTLVLEARTFPNENDAAAVVGFYSYIVLLSSVALVLLTSFRTISGKLRVGAHARRLAALGGVGYGVFFLFASNLITVPSQLQLQEIPPDWAHNGFLFILTAYGPYTYWPIAEMWIPSLHLFIAVSLGTGPLVVFLSTLMYYNFLLMYAFLRERQRGTRSRQLASSTGSLVTSCLTNGCGCCTSLVTPLILTSLGASSTGYLAGVLNGAPLVGDSVVTLDFALLLGGIFLFARHLPKRTVGVRSPSEVSSRSEPPS